MKKFTVVLLMAIGFTNLAFAQSAKQILDGVSAKFKSFKAVTAKFTLKIENAAGKAMGSKSGTLHMKGNKYHVLVKDQELFSDGNSLWTYDKVDNEVTITRIDPAANTITPQKIFTNFYDKDFVYKLNGEKKSGAKMIQEIELTPTDKSKNFNKVFVFIDKAAQTISSTKVIEKTGNQTTISVSNMNSTGAVADAVFTFDAKKFPGVHVEDLR